MPVSKRPRTNSVTNKGEREETLREEWYASLPCANCKVNEVCKYRDTFKRPDFDPSIFSIEVTCKLHSSFN